MNQTILISNETSIDDKNKSILIVIILSIIIFLSLIVFLYICIIMPKIKTTSKDEIHLWRNAIIKNDINLEDIYKKEKNKNLIVNPIIVNI